MFDTRPAMAQPLAQQAYVKSSNSGFRDAFGQGIALSGNTLVVGAQGESSDATGINGAQDNDLANFAGAVYVFVRDGASWSQQAYIKASNTDALDSFGFALDIHGDTLVVGAPAEDSAATGIDGDQADNSASNAGAVYVFTRSAGTWTQQAYLKASNSAAGDQFGEAVALFEDTLVVGAPGQDGNGINSGAAYVFVRSGNGWSEQAFLVASNPDVSDVFGVDVDVHGDTLVVGAQGESSSATGVNGDQADDSAPDAGAAYVFVRNGANWAQQAYLKASNTDANDRFGASVSIFGDLVAVGAPLEASAASGVDGDQQDNSAVVAGAAYVFAREDGTWSQEAYVKASNTATGDQFGRPVALRGTVLAAGAFGEDSGATGVDGDLQDNSVTGAGAAYLLSRGEAGWSHTHYLKASNPDSDDNFGRFLDLSADILAVAAIGEDSGLDGIDPANPENNNQSEAGAVYVFAGNLGGSLVINAGLNDAWFNPGTPGQGFFFNVFPGLELMFLAWFTYDTERPPQNVMAVLGEPGHRWLTAIGGYEGDTAALDFEITEGGVFDAVPPAVMQTPGYGTITVQFHDCQTGTVTYSIPAAGVTGEMPIRRIVPDNIPLCEALQ